MAIEGKTLHEVAVGYSEITYNLAGQAWCIHDGSPHFMSEYYGRWRKYELPENAPESIGIDEAGNGWLVSRGGSIYFFDQRFRTWSRLRNPPKEAATLSGALGQRIIVPARTGPNLVTTGASKDDPGGKGFDVWQKVGDDWLNRGGWFYHAAISPNSNDIWALTGDRELRYFEVSKGHWVTVLMESENGDRERYGAYLATNEDSLFVLAHNRQKLWIRAPDGLWTAHETTYIDGGFPVELHGAPEGKGITLLYRGSGGFAKFWQ